MDKSLTEQIQEAADRKDLSALMRLTGLLADVLTHQRLMTRKERRAWYHANKKRLSLPLWGKLEALEK